MDGIFSGQHPPKLDQCCDSEDAANDPVQDMLVIVDLFSDQQPSEDEHTITDESSDADSQDIGVIMV